MKKAELKNNLPVIVIKTLCAGIALVYLVFLIAGKQIFGADNFFYKGINIFLAKDGANVWLRSLGYAIFLPALSYLVRLILKQVAKRLKKGKALVDLLCSFIKYIAVIALIFAILSAWGVNTAALLAGVGILSLIVGLGAQPLIEDIIAGLFIVFEHVFEVGDIIVVDGFRGTVKEIGIRTTQIEDAGGDVKVVNNSDIRTLVNMTSQLSLAISEKDNLDSLRKNIPDIAEGPFYMGVSKLGASGVTLRFTAKCPETQKYQVERDMNRQLKLLFDRNGINIPFTQVVVHEARPAGPTVTGRSEDAEKFIDEQRKLSKGMDDDEQN